MNAKSPQKEKAKSTHSEKYDAVMDRGNQNAGDGCAEAYALKISRLKKFDK